jgi:transposase
MSAPQSDEELYQLSKEELVKIIQALRAELERLKEIVNKDSKSSSKPPSQDIIKKSEKKKSEQLNRGCPPPQPLAGWGGIARQLSGSRPRKLPINFWGCFEI